MKTKKEKTFYIYLNGDGLPAISTAKPTDCDTWEKLNNIKTFRDHLLYVMQEEGVK